MPSSAARRASTPWWLPIQAWLTPCARSMAATARPGLVWPPVPPPAIRIVALPGLFAVALQGQLEEALDEVGIGQAGGLPHPRVPAGRGEAGNGVDLVHEDRAALEEEVYPGHAGAVDGAEGLHRQLTEARGQLGRQRRGAHQPGLALRVLGRIVVPLTLVDDLAG